MSSIKVVFFSLLAFLLIAFLTPIPAESKEIVQWKSTETQWIKGNKWTTLDFNGKSKIKKLDKNRALYCTQVGFHFTKANKPKYVKVRFARILPDGSKDTTGTNTWVLGKNAPLAWHGSTCWSISTKHPVTVQVKVGGSKKYESHLRQFKAWSPSSSLPEDFLPHQE